MNGLSEQTVVNRLRQLGLIENPFFSYPDARYFVPCVEHTSLYKEILRLCVGEPRQRVALIRGEKGAGKTTLTTRLSSTVFADGVISMPSVLVSEEIPTPTTFVRTVNDTLGLDTRRSLAGRLEVLKAYASQQTAQGKGLFLIIDENVNSQVWSTLLEILDWQEDGQLLSVRAAVFSESNLFKFEETKTLLREYVSVRRTMSNLSFSSATRILENRPKMAGRAAPLLQPGAVSEIVEYSNGHPGTLISLANKAFQKLLGSNEDSISLQMVLEARSKIEQEEEGYVA
ncbi:MAG: hypothetical protein KGY39_04830 [Anaerolineales bacterium]|nr:hypothetical protein [Anaerolineales bacterium]